MKKETRNLILPEGNISSPVMFFEESDRTYFKKMFFYWVELNKASLSLGSTRIVNIPESLTEGIFGLEMNFARVTYGVTDASSSFDNYDFVNNKRIQLKAASSTGPSSFGPRSQYDDIYFFYFKKMAESSKNKRNFSGYFEIFKLDPKTLPNLILNKAKNETFSVQQNQGRRPRFSIPKELINPYSLKPIKIGNIEDW